MVDRRSEAQTTRLQNVHELSRPSLVALVEEGVRDARLPGSTRSPYPVDIILCHGVGHGGRQLSGQEGGILQKRPPSVASVLSRALAPPVIHPLPRSGTPGNRTSSTARPGTRRTACSASRRGSSLRKPPHPSIKHGEDSIRTLPCSGTHRSRTACPPEYMDAENKHIRDGEGRPAYDPDPCRNTNRIE